MTRVILQMPEMQYGELKTVDFYDPNDLVSKVGAEKFTKRMDIYILGSVKQPVSTDVC